MEHSFNKRYVGRFVGISFLVWMALSFTPFPPIFNVVALAVVAYFVGKRFAKDNSRMPELTEKNRFSAIGSLAMVLIMGTIAFLLYQVSSPEEQTAMMAPLYEKSWSVKIFGTFIAGLMIWGSVHSGFALGAHHYLKKLEPKAEV